MKHIKYVLGIALLVIVGGLLWASFLPNTITLGPGNDRELVDRLNTLAASRIKVSFTFTPENISFYNHDWEKDLTVLDASRDVVRSNNLIFETKDYGELGVLVTEINGYKNGTDGKYWQFWVNGEQPQIAANRYILQPGDTLQWKFETSTL